MHEKIYAKVTPYVGVWIETSNCASLGLIVMSLLMWECGLKPAYYLHCVVYQRHSLCGSVD